MTKKFIDKDLSGSIVLLYSQTCLKQAVKG